MKEGERHRDDEVKEGERYRDDEVGDMQSSDSQKEMRVPELSQVISSPDGPNGMNIVNT